MVQELYPPSDAVYVSLTKTLLMAIAVLRFWTKFKQLLVADLVKFSVK